MSDLTVDVLVTNVVNAMSDSLDDKQLNKLKDQLYITLHDVEISNKCYDLSTTIEENDTKKLEYLIASMKITHLSDGTIRQYVNSAKRLRTFVGKNFEDITSIDVKFFLATCQKENGWKDTTMQNTIRNLKSVFGFFQREELIEKNPMDKITNVKLEQPIKEAFSPVEMEKLRLACRSQARESALIEFLGATGIRVSELCKLKWNDLDMRHMSFVVKGKGNKEREVPFNEKTGFYLLRYMDERMSVENRSKEEILLRPLFAEKKKNPKTKDYEALTVDGVRHILNKLGEKADVKEIYPHKFRRTFATDAINHGMPIEHISLIMGHAKYETTQIYAHIKTSTIDHSYRVHCE